MFFRNRRNLFIKCKCGAHLGRASRGKWMEHVQAYQVLVDPCPFCRRGDRQEPARLEDAEREMMPDPKPVTFEDILKQTPKK